MVPVYMEMRSDEKILQKQEKTPHLHRSGICLPAWNFRYIDLNSRFPKAPTQAYGLGEWMPTGKAEICAVEAKILKGEEMEKYYEEEFGGEKIIGMSYKEREIFMKLKIRNVGDDTLRVSRLVHQVHFEAYPAGCANGIDEYYFPVEQIEPQEEAEGVISIALSRGDVDDKEYDTFIKNNTIRLVKSAYPVIKMIEFKIGE